MAVLGTILGVASIASSVISGITNSANRSAQNDEKRKQLNTALNQLAESRNQSLAHNQESYDLANRQLQASYNLNVNQTTARRDRTLGVNAQGMALQNELANAEMARLQVEASEAEGSANQVVATSGFRGTGSGDNIVDRTVGANQRQLRAQRLQMNLNKFQSYQSALGSYLDSNAQLEQYKLNLQQQMESNQLSFRQNRENIELTYRQNSKGVREDLNYMNSAGFKTATTLGYASDIFSGVTDAVGKAYNNGWLD